MSLTNGIVEEFARLAILLALAEMSGNHANLSVLKDVLEYQGMTRTANWVREQVAWLGRAGATELRTDGPVPVARILDLGMAHIERRLFIKGVAKPSRMAPL